MGCKAYQCNKISIPEDIFIVKPSLKGWATKAKEASPHEVRLNLLDINSVLRYFMLIYGATVYINLQELIVIHQNVSSNKISILIKLPIL